MQTWNFGTLAARCEPQNWRQVLALARLGVNGRTSTVCLAGLCLMSVVWLFLRWRKGEPPAFEFSIGNQAFLRWHTGGPVLTPQRLGQLWLAVGACVLLYLSGPLIFFNLYYVHDYYYFENTIFLVGATALCLVAMFEMGRAGKAVALLLLLLAAGGSVHRYLEYYYGLQSKNNDEILALCHTIRERTRPDEMFVCFGHDWCSDVAYYSQRRALVAPDWLPESLEKLVGDLSAIHDQPFGALVIDRAGSKRFPPETVLKEMARNGFQTQFISTHEKLELYSLKLR